jgi:hypothetical protein
MSHLLLERLSKKSTKSSFKPIEIKLGKGQIQVDQQVVDGTDSNYDMASFKQRLKNRRARNKQPSETKEEETKEEELEALDEDLAEDLPSIIKDKTKIGKTRLPSSKITKQRTSKIKKSRKQKKPIEEIELNINASLIQVGDRQLGDRLSNKEPSINIKASSYYMNNREYFINFINTIFRKYSKELKEGEEVTCESLTQSKSKDFSLMIHQQIVRDYINLYTPYRGLLLFHGLGAGKTCASIAITEGLKTTNGVIIMTPASLRMNYISELKNCGDPIYKINQFWEKIHTSGNQHIEKALSEILNIPSSHIRKQGWAWMVDVKKDSNFDTLGANDQKSINDQVNLMLQKKYKFINYNGMRQAHLDKMITESENMSGTSNPFDNKVIIIDEAHNFVSRIVNKLKKKKQTLSIQLYELLLSANNCRLVFLTGTPIINYPNEIAVLFNMLRGYIKTYYIKLDTSESNDKVSQQFIMDIFKREKLLDYVEYSPASTTLTITRNPFGFINKINKNGSYSGVNSSPAGLKTDKQFISYITGTLRENNIAILQNQTEIENHKALPDLFDAFKSLFIDNVTGKMKQENLFKRRIIGLTSYFRSASESLLPRYEDTPKYTHVEKIPMSNFQVASYEKARAAERKEEDRNAKKKAKQQKGVYEEVASTYRVFSRAFCNFVFPNEIDEETNILISRPMPKSELTLEQTISTKKIQKGEQKEGEKKISKRKASIDEDMLDGIQVDEKLQNQDGLYTAADEEKLEKQRSEVEDTSYGERKKRALHLLDKNAKKYLTPVGLSTYSPKFKKVLSNLKNPDNVGLHLIYSQFRSIEGVGILSLILNHNGFAKFSISKKSGVWLLDIPDKDRGKPTYALYTGTETAEEKEIIRNSFNGSWDAIPSSLSKQLREINQNNNLGEIIKILMITSSGSEGITLKNTRFVHLIEPYWHPVRTDQVIGRARRICSHKDLPEELKTVEVFIYLMTFTDKQINGDKDEDTKEGREPVLSLALRNSKADKSKMDRLTSYTSDETLFEISSIKKNTSNSILRAIKSSSIDCSIHSSSNKKENIACYTFGDQNVNSFAYKPNYSTEEKDTVAEQNFKSVIWNAYPISIEGDDYAIKRKGPVVNKVDKKIGEIYDLDSYMAAKDDINTNPILMGRTEINPRDPKKIIVIWITDKNF